MPTHKKVLSEVDAALIDPDNPPLPTGVEEVTEMLNGIEEKQYYVNGQQAQPGDYIITDGDGNDFIVTAEAFATDYETI